ncbi:MAG: transporter [Gemmatimonadales bacterium]
MRRTIVALFILAAMAAPLSAQTSGGLRDLVTDLFRFGNGCTDPVCLSVDGTHGDHYNPAVQTGQFNLINFLTDAIGVSVSNIPISAASGGAIWGRSAQGLPVRTETSSGPVFAERGQTLGRGRLLFATSMNHFDYRSIRGVPLDGLVLTFTHEDNDPAGLGNPNFESDIIEVRTNIGLSVTSITSVLSYGLTDFLDLSVAVPLVRTSLDGTSEAQIIPFENPTPHFFGTDENPLLRVTTSASGSSTGVGDIALRLKLGVANRPGGAFALLGDVRLPTGKEEDFLGAGGTSFSVLGVGSLRSGAFSPHLNAGYIHRGGEFQNDAILATVGFDHLMARRMTLAVDLITSWQVGETKLDFPEPVTVNALVGPSSAVRIIRPTNIPDRRDDIALASIGGKIGLSPAANLLLNTLIPLRQGGLQPNAAWMAGLEFSF